MALARVAWCDATAGCVLNTGHEQLTLHAQSHLKPTNAAHNISDHIPGDSYELWCLHCTCKVYCSCGNIRIQLRTKTSNIPPTVISQNTSTILVLSWVRMLNAYLSG